MSPSLPFRAPTTVQRLPCDSGAPACIGLRLVGLRAERHGSQPVGLASYHRYLKIQDNVCDSEAGHLTQTDSGIDEESDDGQVSAVGEVPFRRRGEEARSSISDSTDTGCSIVRSEKPRARKLVS